jgi:very-short-patch-repair endonuclease
MRRNTTPSERILWNRLRDKQTGFRFRQQAVILGWIADFYCPKTKLIVEVDGGYHFQPAQIEKDMARDAVLRSHGFKVFHVSSAMVEHWTNEVVYAISIECQRILRAESHVTAICDVPVPEDPTEGDAALQQSSPATKPVNNGNRADNGQAVA